MKKIDIIDMLYSDYKCISRYHTFVKNERWRLEKDEVDKISDGELSYAEFVPIQEAFIGICDNFECEGSIFLSPLKNKIIFQLHHYYGEILIKKECCIRYVIKGRDSPEKFNHLAFTDYKKALDYAIRVSYYCANNE